MNARHASVLVVVAVVAIAAALWATKLREPAPASAIGTALLPGLEEAVNDVTAVHIYSGTADPAVSLERDDTAWRVAQKHGYRADPTVVRELLLGLANARLLEQKTANPAYYDRLGVGDEGLRVELEGVEVMPLMIGNTEFSRDATYVRGADEPQSWLASGVLEPDADPLQWLEREIVDLPRERVAEVEVVHPDGERVLAAKSAFGETVYTVDGVPDGRELSRPGAADPLAGVLAALRYEDVVPAAQFEFPDDAVVVTLRTFDGVAIEARVAAVDEQYYARFAARADEEIVARYQAAPVSDDEAETEGESVAPDMAAAEAEAEQLDAAWSGWVYRLPKYKYDTMTTRLDELLAPPSVE